jgi:putative nucleotidyltransferase with HDIG domain
MIATAKSAMSPFAISRSAWADMFARDVHEGLHKKLLKGVKIDQRYLGYLTPNHPLLKALRRTAHGTFRHSIIVGSIAASSAAKVNGANPDLCRLLGYFHDTGKMFRPELYSESLVGDRANPKKIETVADLKIMLNHPLRSRDNAWQYRLPGEICDLLIEHHGTVKTRIRLSDNIPDKDLHYCGPRPSTIESAIVMFVDSASAYFEREMDERGWLTEDHSATRILTRIQKIHDEVQAEGQFDENVFSRENQALVTDAIKTWLVRFYTHMRLFGTPRAGEVLIDGRLPWPEY